MHTGSEAVLQGKRSRGIPGYRWEDNIAKNLKEIIRKGPGFSHYRGKVVGGVVYREVNCGVM